MATPLFHAKVMEVRDTRVVLKLRIITGEQPDFYSGPSFALMLLYGPIVKEMVRNAPLAREVTFEQTIDVDWLDEHIDNYIQSTVLDQVKNLPITADLDAMSSEQWSEFFQSDRAPSARFEITVTRPEWLSHLHEGMEWDTAAYEALP